MEVEEPPEKDGVIVENCDAGGANSVFEHSNSTNCIFNSTLSESDQTSSLIIETFKEQSVELEFRVANEQELCVNETIALIGIKIKVSVDIQKPTVEPPRISFTLADRDQLRAMIVMLNESNGVLLKIRQRFPLSAPTRCDVIQRQIQMQLQELFGEFRNNDVVKFKEMIPTNRDAFLLIWEHLSQLIVDLCYHN